MSDNEQLPPSNRSTLWGKVNEAAADGQFVLPVCQNCQTVQYPPREICNKCLNHKLEWKAVDSCGTLLSISDLRASAEGFFREHLPWLIGLVKLDSGPVIFVHRAPSVRSIGDRIRVLNKLDKSGQAVFIAIPESEEEADSLLHFSMLLA